MEENTKDWKTLAREIHVLEAQMDEAKRLKQVYRQAQLAARLWQLREQQQGIVVIK